MNRKSYLYPVVIAVWITLALSACRRSPDVASAGQPHSPSLQRTAVSWSAPKAYHWGEFKPGSLAPPRDTTIDMGHLSRVPLGPSVMQPFAHSPEVIPVNFPSLPDTTIDMHKLRAERLTFTTRTLGRPSKRDVSLPRVRDGAAMSILTYGQQQNLVPGTIVYMCNQDPEGRMWFGTTAGLCMFDGVNSYVYTQKQGIASNSVWALRFNGDGTFWSGGLAGLDLIDLAHGLVHHVTGPHWFDSAYVFNIHTMRDGRMLMGLSDGAAILDPVHLTITKFTSREGLRAAASRVAIEDKQGLYWFGTPAGLRVLDPVTGRIRYIDPGTGLAEGPINSIDVDRHDRIWIGDGAAGLLMLNPQRTAFTRFTESDALCSNFVRGVEEMADGTYWVGSSSTEGGLTHLDLKHGTSERLRPTDGLAASLVTSIFLDREQQLWVTSWTGGVATLNSRIGLIHHFGTPQGLSGSLPGGILCTSDGRIWMGSEQGIDILTPGRSCLERITSAQLQTKANINGLREDSRGRIWITFSSDGVSVLDPVSGHISNYGMEQGICEYATRRTFEDPSGSIWIASITGLNCMSPDLHSIRYLDSRHGLSHYANCDVIYDSSGHLWIGNGAGIDRYDLKTQEIRHLILTPDARPIGVNCLLRDRAGRIWIGTNDEGLYIVDPRNSTAVHLGESQGLRDLTVRSLIQVHNDIFVGTRHGLFKIASSDMDDRSSMDNFAVRAYSEDDGMINTDFQYRAVAMSADSTLYWCTGAQVTSFRPAEEMVLATTTRITTVDVEQTPFTDAINAARIHGLAEGRSGDLEWSGLSLPYLVPASLRVPIDKDHLTFHFTSDRTVGVSHTQYQYYVEGLDAGWGSSTSIPYAEYRNLPSGHYTFKVRSRTDNGAWSNAAVLDLTVTPPWYASTWAYLLYLVNITGAVLGYIRIRQTKLIARQSELERTVAERTADLDEQKKRAERSEHSKQEFLANMSHEIRTPMNAVMGLTNLLIDENPLPEQREYLEHIRRSSESLLVILNDILDFSKMEAGKIELELIPIDIRAILSSVEATIRIKASDKGLQVHVSCDDRIPQRLMGDPTRLQQVLLNLAGNAVKFTERGSIRIVCTPGVAMPGTDSFNVQFRVEDSGIGMSSEQIERVFQSFAQASTETTRLYGGTGLGLSISRQLVELMHGELRVRSTPGVGSTFEFNVPLDYLAPSEARSLATPLATLAEELRGIRILLAEDNELNRVVARETLMHAIPDITLDEATNGEEALAQLAIGTYDIVLMDAHMPVLDGYQAAARIRTSFASPTREIPIIALTAAVIPSEIQKCKAYGMNGYVAKPYRAETLVSSIHRVLRLRMNGFLRHDEIDRARSVGRALITDLTVLTASTGADEVLQRKYIGLYVEGTRGHLDAIASARDSHDMQRVRAIVHQLRPHMKMMGMSLTAEIAEEIEARIESDDTDDPSSVSAVVPDLLDQLVRDCQRSIIELKHYLDA